MSRRNEKNRYAAPDALNLKENLQDVLTAHSYRLSLNEGPNQSNFRVVALVFYDLKPPSLSSYRSDHHPIQHRNNHMKIPNGKGEKDGRRYVVGTNEEPCYMGGSICAERAALVQLRFIPNLDRVTKVVIATDAETEVMPGMLCREFMASLIPWDTPIVLAGSICSHCGLNISASKVWTQETGSLAAQSECAGICFASYRKCKNSNPEIVGMHDFLRMKTTVKELYPFPSPFTKLSSKQCIKVGKAFSSRSIFTETTERNNMLDCDDTTTETKQHTVIYADSPSRETSKKSINKYVRNRRLGHRRSVSTTSTGDITDSSESPVSGSPVRSEEKRELIGVDRRQEPSDPTEDNSMLTQLLAKHVLNRAKKAAEKDNKSLHPIQYGAAVLFSDGTIATSHQKPSQEYGCTLDAVTQLAQIMEEKVKQRCLNGEEMIKAILLVQSDQYGIAHAPFAQARAFLTEYGYNDTFIVIHDSKVLGTKDNFENKDCTKIVKVQDLAPHTLGLGSDILNNSQDQSLPKSQL